ncbi:hypothetical protein OZ666_17615 [Elizabethkingia sp. HX QKY]|uniref:bacteriocin-like protein n=1 Tax=Elizabethkingia TaxID=308865 RepID=UPI002A23F8A2|nr:hypothetical protein [Elizabethkingia sp. HX QKY]MDX8573516.1 hypothetical protein [Elizabethkingia sp. HX QKY]
MKNLKKLSRNELKTLTGGRREVHIGITTCGFTATTTQDWTAQQAIEWVEKLEANYCNPKPASHYGPSENLA